MIILLTGNPHVGKTSLLNLFYEDGYLVFNVDEYINEIYKVNQIGYILISQHFGKEYTNKNVVNKEKLLKLILEDKNERQRLIDLIWPLIRSKLFHIKNNYKNVIVEMAIYKLNPEYFQNIFNIVFEISRQKQETIPKNKNDITSIFKPSSTYHYDYLIDNNNDLLMTYHELKETIDQLFEEVK